MKITLKKQTTYPGSSTAPYEPGITYEASSQCNGLVSIVLPSGKIFFEKNELVQRKFDIIESDCQEYARLSAIAAAEPDTSGLGLVSSIDARDLRAEWIRLRIQAGASTAQAIAEFAAGVAAV